MARLKVWNGSKWDGVDADTWRGKNLLDVGLEYQAGDNIVIYSDASEVSTCDTLYTEKKACIIGRDGTVRISFAMHPSSSSTTAYTAYGRIYKNGVAVGTERFTSSVRGYEPVVFTEDIAVSKNDRISLYLRSSSSGKFVAICDFVIRINYDGSTYRA